MKKSHFYPTDDAVVYLDQRLLPNQEHYCIAQTTEHIFEAIVTLQVRGAPLIGVAAAYGVWLAALQATTTCELQVICAQTIERLRSARPTAVNLTTELARIQRLLLSFSDELSIAECIARVRKEADTIRAEDEASCKAIGKHMQEFIPENARILTHCNAGELATAGYGTALSGIYTAFEMGKNPFVWVDETRPWLQGARLTAWELQHHGIEHKLVVDSCAAWLMRQGMVDVVITGADRIAANGDTANKIGTYMLACAARENNIPFIIAAPSTTWDISIADGKSIVIEERDHDEIRMLQGHRITQNEQNCYNPVFDVTPVHLITAHVSEKGIIRHSLD